jgi:hypothetical protein
MMTTLLLLARPVFAALLVAVVGLYIWTGYQADRRAPASTPSQGPDQPKGRRGK